MNVLVIEDDKRIANLVERALTEDGHRVTVSDNGREGVDMLLSGRFDAALLDILLPEIDGFEVLEQVRTKHCKTPILVLTAVDAVPKIVHAFDLGADDYLVKPFILEILKAHVGAIARRIATIELPPVTVGSVTLDRSRRVAVRHGKEIALTRKQFELLETLNLADNTVLIIRHSEKPEEGTGLTRLGEERARLYAKYFEPFQEQGLSIPVDCLYAGADSKNSMRPRLTLEPISKSTGLTLHHNIGTKDSEALVRELKAEAHGRHPLIAWRHGEILPC